MGSDCISSSSLLIFSLFPAIKGHNLGLNESSWISNSPDYDVKFSEI